MTEMSMLQNIKGLLVCIAIGCLPGPAEGAESSPRRPGVAGITGQVRVIPATDSLIRNAAAAGDTISRLLEAAKSTIGVPYQWGGTRLEKAIDCSNYTWQLYRTVGMPYDRFLSTLTLSGLKKSNGLRKISFQEARAGDLLVYGYRDADRKWRGHVVILVDKEGANTGHEGLVLGAHGGEVGAVRFVTFRGFHDGYFKEPKMRLCNVLRPDGS